MKKLQLLFLICLAYPLIACGGNAGSQFPSASPTAQLANGFGTAANHVHSLVVLPDANHTLVMATHFGIFRSQDHGATWQETAAGPKQPMLNLMAYSLSFNPLDPQRLYVLTQIALVPYTGILGLYTSSDAGKTWQLALTYSSINVSSILFARAGNESPSEVYIYLNALGPSGLRVSKDNGQHFSQAGSQLPFSNALGLLAIPNKPGHLIVYGSNGVATTADGGAHWQVVPGIQGSIFVMTTPGPNDPIYGEGDAGIYVSNDGGKSFTLVESQHSYASLTASPEQPQIVYGKLGLGIYRSTDSGKTWSALPTLKLTQQSLTGDVLVADPTDANQVYLVISYPTVAYYFQSADNSRKSFTPSV